MYTHLQLSNNESFQKCEAIIENNIFNTLTSWPQVLKQLTVNNPIFYQYLSEKVRMAISNGDLNRFKKLRQVAIDYLRHMPKKLLEELDATDFQESLLSLAVFHKQYLIAKELLLPGIYDPYYKDKNGNTVFDIVIECNDTKMLGILLAYWSASEKDLKKLSSSPSDDSELNKIYELYSGSRNSDHFHGVVKI